MMTLLSQIVFAFLFSTWFMIALGERAVVRRRNALVDLVMTECPDWEKWFRLRRGLGRARHLDPIREIPKEPSDPREAKMLALWSLIVTREDPRETILRGLGRTVFVVIIAFGMLLTPAVPPSVRSYFIESR